MSDVVESEPIMGSPAWRKNRVSTALRTGLETWPYIDSEVMSYEESFCEVLGSTTIAAMVRETYAQLQRPVRIVDFLATPTVLSELSYLSGANITGTSVSLSDNRVNWVKHEDTERGISHVVGDLADVETYRKLRRNMKGEKADIVLERAWGGLSWLPREADFYETALNAMLHIMRPGAVLLAQLPNPSMCRTAGLAHPLTCVNELRAQGVEKITAGYDKVCNLDVIQLVKTTDIPRKVYLPRRNVR